jgi:hypothetical protein
MTGHVARRACVIVPMLGLMTLWVAWWNGRLPAVPGVTPAMSTVFLLGPFVGLWGPVIGYEADSVGYILATGLPLLVMIGSHPAVDRAASAGPGKA